MGGTGYAIFPTTVKYQHTK